MENSSIDELVAAQHGMVSRAQMRTVGATEGQLRWRIRPGGPWQVLLPGVYATFTGTVTPLQWWQGALLYAGAGAVLTGEPALYLQGIGEPRNPRIPVLVGHERHRASRKQVSIFRTERMPVTERVAGLVVADPVRATVDACRIALDVFRVRALITEALRSPHVGVSDLAREVDEGQSRGSARLRAVLGEYGAGVRSVAEAVARERVLALPLPVPLFNVDLLTPDGRFLARPDVYWAEAGLVLEIDSRRHHGDMEGWEHTQRRHTKLSAQGLTVLHASPHRIQQSWVPLGREIVSAHAIGCTRPPPRVIIAAA
ncbi:MAG: hypothetical protein GEV10_20750 [Streptosporangiales bacterium]|nr:hypothetical protein [Streptosporangiales bacterium]